MLLDNLKALKAKFIEQGIEQGIEKNRLAEEKKRDDIIKNLLRIGTSSVSDIAKSFSLPMEHILKLQSQLA